MQLIASFAICGALVAGGAAELNIQLLIIGLAIFFGCVGLNLFATSLLLAPLKDISAALTHIAGEPTTTKPPNPNAAHYERDGFKPLLQTIYSLGASREDSEAKVIAKNAVPFDIALNEIKTGIVILDHSRTIMYANKAAPVRINEQNQPVLELLFDDETSTLSTWLDECETSAVHSDRVWKRIPNKIVGSPDRRIFDIAASYEKGSEAETVLVFSDNSVDYQMEDDGLDFIAFAAHELRGPITVIHGYLDVLQQEMGDTMSAEQNELLKRLVVSSNRLSSYVSNILNASRYDRRHLKVHLSEDTLANVYATISDDMSLRASSQNRLLNVNFPDNLPTIAADRASLSEVIGNLIDNAIKYSNEGGSVSVTAAADARFVKVMVEDRGIGMPSSVVSNLFHKFYRSHRSRETVAGTGIGLYISKAIVESHGGTIGVRSVEGQGSTFEFTVPTYASVAEKLSKSDNSNEDLISHGEGWIKNHAMYRG